MSRQGTLFTDSRPVDPQAGVEKPEWWNIIARRKLGVSDAWRWWEIRRIGMTNDALLIGAVPAGFTKAGRPKWPSRANSQEVVITDAEMTAEKEAWERATGKCHNCYGTGQESAGWSLAEGPRYRDCPRCGTTGHASQGARGEGA